MELLRTPDARFVDLPEFDFEPRFTTIESSDGTPIRVHHVEEGQGPPVLLLHGEPSWSFLYRRMIPPLAASGYRAVAPDLVGFGRSDKPASMDDFSYAALVEWTERWLVAMDLADITLFCQDWGGLVGLRLVAAHPDRFRAVVAANTGLPTGDQDMGAAFLAWREFSRTSPLFEAGWIVQGATVRDLPAEVVAAYDAPFPDDSFKAGPRILPSLVPASPDDPARADQEAAWEVLKGFHKPFVTAFSDSDPITAGGDRVFRKLVPGAAGMPHVTVETAGHFLQEDQPDRLVEVILAAARLGA